VNHQAVRSLVETREAWLQRYATAWRDNDLSLAAGLFTDEVEYSFDPFREPIKGRHAVLDYWRQAFTEQRDLRLAVRLWAVTGDAAAAEWWAAFERNGADLTLSASLLLRFDAEGRCLELHEHWLQHDARLEPPSRFGGI
jgi:ketosteroid isomerase-like protein